MNSLQRILIAVEDCFLSRPKWSLTFLYKVARCASGDENFVYTSINFITKCKPHKLSIKLLVNVENTEDATRDTHERDTDR